jgi:hypothetical protein
VFCMYIIHTTLVDFKASGEESKVPLRNDECRPTGNTAAQTKEEGWQDGLRPPLPGGSGGARHRGIGVTLFTFSSPQLCRHFLHSLPFHLFKFCCLMLRLGVRRFILAVILAEKRLRRWYGLKETFGPDLAYGCWMAGACTMTVMRRGESGGGEEMDT